MSVIKVGEPTGSDCPNCGEPVIRRKQLGQIPKFCSQLCLKEFKKREQRQAAAESRKGMVCEWCGEGIPDQGKRVRFCNHSCSKASHHARRMADPAARARFLKTSRQGKARAKARAREKEQA